MQLESKDDSFVYSCTHPTADTKRPWYDLTLSSFAESRTRMHNPWLHDVVNDFPCLRGPSYFIWDSAFTRLSVLYTLQKARNPKMKFKIQKELCFLDWDWYLILFGSCEAERLRSWTSASLGSCWFLKFSAAHVQRRPEKLQGFLILESSWNFL